MNQMTFKRLKFLILADNKINTMASVYKPPGDVSGGEEVTLKVNEFGSRMGLVPNLVVLHLRKNGIRSLQGFTKEAFASLKYLNLRYHCTSKARSFCN
uniref:Recep_L_domain domain-containing protein n=1 Tax=Mesocestoides corti TaxID=53468 RepID=A0A5K3ETC2_MESCO